MTTMTLFSPTKSQSYPPEKWMEMRPVIIDLYQREKLSEMMSVLADQYRFCATRAMYKKHFKAWGVSKNLKAVEKDDMILDHGSGFLEETYDLVLVKKLKRHLKDSKFRKSVRRHSYSEAPGGIHRGPTLVSGTQTGSNCNTENLTLNPPSTIARPLMLSRDQNDARLLFEALDVFMGSIELQRTLIDGSTYRLEKSSQQNDEMILRADPTFYDLVLDACSSLQLYQCDVATRFFQEAGCALEILLKNHKVPRLEVFGIILKVTLSPNLSSYQGHYAAIMKLILSLSGQALGTRDPMVQLLEQWCKHSVKKAWRIEFCRRMTALIETHPERSSYDAFLYTARRFLYQALERDGQRDRALKICWIAFQDLATKDNDRLIAAKLDLAWLYFKTGELDRATEVFRELRGDLVPRCLVGLSRTATIKALHSARALCFIHEKRQNHNLANIMYWKVFEENVRLQGEHGPDIMLDFFHLVEYHKRRNNVGMAQELNRRHPNLYEKCFKQGFQKPDSTIQSNWPCKGFLIGRTENVLSSSPVG